MLLRTSMKHTNESLPFIWSEKQFPLAETLIIYRNAHYLQKWEFHGKISPWHCLTTVSYIYIYNLQSISDMSKSPLLSIGTRHTLILLHILVNVMDVCFCFAGTYIYIYIYILVSLLIHKICWSVWMPERMTLDNWLPTEMYIIYTLTSKHR